MCLLLLQFRDVPESPLMVGFNREEFFGRPAAGPQILPDDPAIMCGLDRRAGGTWLGVNEFGLFVAVTNRLKSKLPAGPRSRGLLCLDLLRSASCREAIAQAASELSADRYAGANFVCADSSEAAVVHGGDGVEIVHLEPGLHLITNANVDDPSDVRQQFARDQIQRQQPKSSSEFVAAARELLRVPIREPGQVGIVLRGEDRGTVSSTILSLPESLTEATYLYADGPPDEHDYADYSPLLQEVLMKQRAGGTKANN